MSDDNVLGESFTITQVKDCIADPSKNRAVSEVSEDIRRRGIDAAKI